MASATVGTKRSFTAMQAGADGLSQAHAFQGPVPAAFDGLSPRTSPVWTSRSRSVPQPASSPALQPRGYPRQFEPDASIVLIGIRGSGKSTLAVMASGVCQKRVIDVESLFQENTGFSTAKYRKQFGASNHNLRQEEILHNTLEKHDRGAIIVCNGSSLERSGQTLLHKFAKSHPVIHVVRDLSSIHQYLETLDMSKLQDLVAFSGPIFRHCSNYEFYNITETKVPFSVIPANQPSVPAFLTLKRAERTFLRFLSLITTPENARNNMSPLEPGFPLSDVATEFRQYTCAVQIPLSVLLSEEADIEQLEFGSDAFEIVVDPMDLDLRMQNLPSERAEQISRAVSRVRRSTVVPIVYHVLPAGPHRVASYMEHVRHGLRVSPEFLTVDLSLDEDLIRDIIQTKGSAKVVGHFHAALNWDNPFWLEKYDAAIGLGCSVARFTRPAQFMDDNAAIQSFRNKVSDRRRKIPLICFNTGRAGRRSACFNQVLTSVIPDSLRDSSEFESMIEKNPETAWLTAREATKALYASFTYDPMNFYVMGASTDYSLSPTMHNAAFKTCGMPHTFRNIQTQTLSSLQELVRQPDFGGTAISLPFKIEVISLIHSLSPHASYIGAVNTLIPVRHLNKDGSIPDKLELFMERNQAGPIKALYGDNTDWIGIRSCIRRGLSPANAIRPGTCGLVIGAGGMARAAVYAMLQLGVKNIIIFNRTYSNAKNLVSHFTRVVSVSPNGGTHPPIFAQGSKPTFHILQSRDDPWPSDLRPPTIILSCIPTHPVGGNPAPEFTLPQQWMQSPTGGVVIELAYRTLNTPLMRQIREKASRSWICLDGLDLLPEQGFAQFELFTGKRAPRRIMREKVLRSWTDEQGRSDPGMVQTRLEAIDDQEP